MTYYSRIVVALLLLTVVRLARQLSPCDSAVYCFGELLEAMQRENVFSDSKQFVDLPMKDDPAVVLRAFGNWTNRSRSGLHQFVNNYFLQAGSDLENWTPTDWSERPRFLNNISNLDLHQWAARIHELWKQLGRKVGNQVMSAPDRHSLLPVPHPFIVPGGRFREFYYWDSYWIVQGLLISGMRETARGMIENMAYLVDQYGLVPNGGRLYYTRRSQPPLLTQMVWLYYTTTANSSFVQQLLPSLDREYQFWMTNRSVSVPPYSCCLNRYAAQSTIPRPESYREDWALASQLPSASRPRLYTDIASAAESGWDFSSRWLGTSEFTSIRTTNIIPVDLNSILCQNERTLEELHRVAGSSSSAEEYSRAWRRRKAIFDNIFWRPQSGLWQDWDVENGRHLPGFYGSTLVPLMWGCGSNITQHLEVLARLRALGVLDYPGGIPTSLNFSSELQWDFPNVWAPLHWFLVAGWQNSSAAELRKVSREVAERWISSVYVGWQMHNQTIFEKYDCTSVGSPGGGGEYVVQAGFGWTNGVILHYLQLYPDLQHPVSSLGWVAAVVILLLFIVASLLCTAGGWWLYHTGKRRYWQRVHCEHLLHSSTSAESTSSPTVIRNPLAAEYSEEVSFSPSTSTSTSSENHLAAVSSSQHLLHTSTSDSSSTIIANPMAEDFDEEVDSEEHIQVYSEQEEVPTRTVDV